MNNLFEHMHNTNFENTLKYSYSHGLEDIYKLETIDPKTIRRILTSQPQSLSSFEEATTDLPDRQLNLDLGLEWNGTLDSFLPTEPIQVLGLSGPVEKIAYANHLICLQDLLNLDLRVFALTKGIGQGHVDEMMLKLSEYMKSKTLGKSKKVDLSSLLKNALGSMDKKHVQLLLEPFRLGGMMPLSALDRLEIKKMALPERESIRQNVQAKLASGPVLEYVCDKLEQIITVLIKPWLRQRQGIGTEAELYERLERVSVQPESTRRMWNCLSNLFFTGTSPFHGCLVEINDGLFAVDRQTHKDTQTILAHAETYFYQPDLVYPFDQLVNYLEREFALNWNAYPEGLISEVLKKTTRFLLFKKDFKLQIKRT